MRVSARASPLADIGRYRVVPSALMAAGSHGVSIGIGPAVHSNSTYGAPEPDEAVRAVAYTVATARCTQRHCGPR
jgi:hypothetical protein